MVVCVVSSLLLVSLLGQEFSLFFWGMTLDVMGRGHSGLCSVLPSLSLTFILPASSYRLSSRMSLSPGYASSDTVSD